MDLCYEYDLQKDSPYLEDANLLINIARESGFINEKIRKYSPNATECLTRTAVQASHFGKDQKLVFKMENIYGMLILLSVGLAGSTLIATAELIVNKVAKS